MKSLLKSICCFIFLLTLFYFRVGQAGSDFDQWKQNFYKQALKSGISQKTLDATVPQMTLLNRIIQQDTEKPEFMPYLYNHIESRVTPSRIEKGRKLAKKYKTWLTKIEEKYGVPKEYLLALWAMETNYGSYMGNVNMRDSLATLAYHPRRREYFTKELIAYLKILDKEESVVPIYGSWDGGFGNFQFMPTTFLAFAVDEDNNGRRDIIHNIPDSLGSAANYLNHLGWRTNEPWGREVVPNKDFDWNKTEHSTQKTVSEWFQDGVSPKDLNSFPEKEHGVIAEFYAPMGKNGPAYLIYPNFKLIIRWNALWLNAITTGLLANAIADDINLPAPPPDFKPLKTKTVICLQKNLQKRGYSLKGADGKIGPKTKTAIQKFQRENGLIPDGYPDQTLIQLLECQND